MSSIAQTKQLAQARETDMLYKRRWWILVVLSTCMLLVAIDATIVNVALPLIAVELPATTSELQWITETYTLALAGLLLTCGTLADKFGSKRLLLLGIATFGLGSAIAAFSPSPAWLIGARAVMGIGGAMLSPTTLSMLRNTFPEGERARAIGIWSASASIGVALGPLVGGWLLDHFWWGAVFLVTVPIALIALIACQMIIPTNPRTATKALDLTGTLLSIISMTGIVYIATEGSILGWSNPLTLTLIGVTILAFLAFLLWERHTASPMLDLHLFKNAQFTIANIATALCYFALFAALFAITQYLQMVLNFSPFIAGLALVPQAIAIVGASLLGSELTKYVARKYILMAGLTLTTLGLGLLTLLTPTSGYPFIFCVLMLTTSGIGMATMIATDMTLNAVGVEQANSASAVNETALELGGTLGIAILGSVLANTYTEAIRVAPDIQPEIRQRMMESLGAAIQQGAKIGHEEGQRLLAVAQTAFTGATSYAALIGMIVLFLAIILTWMFLPVQRANKKPQPVKDSGATE